MTVFLRSRARSERYFTITKEVSESSPEVGSSNMITCGSDISSNAIEVRFLSPPETPLIKGPPIKVSKQASNFKSFASAIMILSLCSYVESNLRSAANLRVSRTVMVCINRSNCMTQLAKSPKCSKAYSRLLAMTEPSLRLEGTLQARMLRRVVLPAPEAPMIAVTSPALKMPETLFRMTLLVVEPKQGTLKPFLSAGTSTLQLKF